MNELFRMNSQFMPLSEMQLATTDFFPFAIETAAKQFEALGSTSSKELLEQSGHHPTEDCVAKPENPASLAIGSDAEHLKIQLDLALKNLGILESQIDFLNSSHAKQIAHISEESNKQAAKLLRESLQELEEKIEARIGEETARILEPFISAQLRLKILDRFKKTVAECLSNEAAIKVSVHGPQHLIEALAVLPSSEGQMRLVVDEGNTELVANFNDQTIATCFAPWADMIGCNA